MNKIREPVFLVYMIILAKAYVKAGIVFFSSIPALFILPIITPESIFLAVAIYFIYK
ncbi:hypothetical protein Clopa_2295 [Clostridium pasteurianum BC1]|uniref:Uncharacterized protein n=1 Tax=Clostridium pasteurianum BC1 TaxID=86416 RepID=R4K238_CLOPA|nr:hypothetical protein Clopa_2295 [Clostridium pasteurianum BC1]